MVQHIEKLKKQQLYIAVVTTSLPLQDPTGGLPPLHPSPQ